MKFAKLSLAAVAAMGITSGAMALDLSKTISSAKAYVNTKLYYETVDGKGQASGAGNDKLFDQGSSSGQALAQIGVNGQFNGCWGYGLEYSVADTLGLENNLVSGVRMGNGEPSYNDRNSTGTDTQSWISQAYVTMKGCGTFLDKTTFKIGRQYLDTPLAFTETWNLAPNSFDAIVAINQDIQNVTLVGAYVGKGNGRKVQVTNGERFESYAPTAAGAGKGAYAIAALTNFGVPVNLWYYNVRDTANAIWADTNFNVMAAKVALQYGKIDPKGRLSALDNTSGAGIKISGSIDGFNLSAAYTKMDNKGTVALANTATMSTDGLATGGTAGGKKTKLYTAGIYTDGTGVAIPGSKAWKVGVSTATPIGKLAINYVDCKNTVANTAATNVKETDIILGTKVLGIDTKLILINRNVEDSVATATTTAATYLKNDTKHVRIILSKKF